MTATWKRVRAPVANAADGSRSLLARVGTDTPTPEQLQAALIDLTNQCVSDGGGCVRLGPGFGPDRLIEIQPDPTLNPRSKVIWQGVPGVTRMRSSEYATASLFTNGEGGWSVLDVDCEGGADLLPPGTSGPSIIVLNGVDDFHYRGGLAHALNNGIVIRGPAARKFRLQLIKPHGFGTPGVLGGGHVVACTGDGNDSPFDTVDGHVTLEGGYDIFNGGLNLGSSRNIRFFAQVKNDYDPAVGPPDSGYPVVRLANGTRGAWGTAIGFGTGRVFRCGPCDELDVLVIAEEIAFEAALMAGTTYTFSGHRGGKSRIRVLAVNTNLIRGENVFRGKSHGPCTVEVELYNRAGISTLRGTAVSVDPGDEDNPDPDGTVQKVMHIRWPKPGATNPGDGSLDNYVFPVTANIADPSKIDWKAVKEATGEVVASVTGIVNTNGALASAINALSTMFTAYPIAGTTNTLEVTTNGRKGPGSNGITIGDIGAVLAAQCNPGDATVTLVSGGGNAIANSPNGEMHYPATALLYDSANNGAVEEVRIDSRVSAGGNVFNITRAQNTTSAQTWPATTGILVVNPSRFTILPSTFGRMATEAIHFIGPAPKTKILPGQRTDEAMVRGVDIGNVLYVPPAVSRVTVTGTVDIHYIYPCHSRRDLIVVLANAGSIVRHGYNCDLFGGRDFIAQANSELVLQGTEEGYAFKEMAPKSRPARIVALGSISGAVSLPLLAGDRHVIVTATLTGATTITPTNAPAGIALAIQLLVTQGGSGSNGLTIGGAKTTGAGALNLSTTVGALDDITVLLPGDGSAAHALRAGKDMR